MFKKERNPDFDRRYIRPTAWRKAKGAFDLNSPCGRIMLRLEHETADLGCVRVLFVVAIGHYLALSREEWIQALIDHIGADRATAPPEFGPLAEALPSYERDELDGDFRRAMGSALGRPGCSWRSTEEHVEMWMEDGRGFLFVCRHCGHELRESIAVLRHLRNKHGIDPDTRAAAA
jgi:hypothetical protein